jgi:hypothetical protein
VEETKKSRSKSKFPKPFHISNLGFYGEDIWYAFTEYCRSDRPMFEACVEMEDKGFYDFVLDWKAQRALEVLKGKDE